MKYPNIKKLKLSHTEIAKAFGFKSVRSFRCSSAHKRYMQGIEEILIKAKESQSKVVYKTH